MNLFTKINQCFQDFTDFFNHQIMQEADINSQNSRGTTAAMLFAKKGQIDSLKTCIDLKADLEITDNKGRTALTHAAQRNQTEAIKLLTENGANTNHLDSQQLTPMLHSLLNKNSDAFFFMAEHGGNINQIFSKKLYTPLIISVSDGDEEFTQKLLEKKADVNLQDHLGATALIWAIAEGNIPTAKLLISNGANLTLSDIFGKTATDYILEAQDSEMKIELKKVLYNDFIIPTITITEAESTEEEQTEVALIGAIQD